MTVKKEEVIRKVKSKGFWEINIHPYNYVENRIEIDKIKDIVKSSIVRLSSWEYPHFSDDHGAPYPILNGIEKTINKWEYVIEFWRMVVSGNFYHLIAFPEDWMGEGKISYIFGEEETKPNEWLGVFRSLYKFTEIFEFAKRLVQQNIFDDKLVVEIKLNRLLNRKLVVDSSKKNGFSFPRIIKVDEWQLKQTIYQTSEVLTKSDELALNAFKDLIRLFDWENPPLENLKDDQHKFLQGGI